MVNMKRLFFAEEHYRTTDAIASRVFELATRLGQSGDAGAVEILAVDSDNRLRTVQLLLGPASQLVVASADEINTTIDDAAVVDELDRLLADARPPRERADTRAVVEAGDEEPRLDMDY